MTVKDDFLHDEFVKFHNRVKKAGISGIELNNFLIDCVISDVWLQHEYAGDFNHSSKDLDKQSAVLKKLSKDYLTAHPMYPYLDNEYQIEIINRAHSQQGE